MEGTGDKQEGGLKGFRLPQPKPIASVTTSQGTLFLYPLIVGDIAAFGSKDAPHLKARKLLARRASQVESEKGIDDAGPLGEAGVAAFTDADIEKAMEAYLASVGLTWAIEKAAKASPPITRGKDETAVAFLDRVLRYEVTSAADEFRRMTNIFGGKTAGAIRKAQDDASTLNSMADQFRRMPTAIATPVPPEPYRGHELIQEAIRERETQRLRERSEELQILRGTAEIGAQSAKTLASLSNSATSFLESFAETSRRNDRFAKTGIVVAVISLLVLAGFAFASYVQDRKHIHLLGEHQSELMEQLRAENEMLQRALSELKLTNQLTQQRLNALETTTSKKISPDKPAKPSSKPKGSHSSKGGELPR